MRWISQNLKLISGWWGKKGGGCVRVLQERSRKQECNASAEWLLVSGECPDSWILKLKFQLDLGSLFLFSVSQLSTGATGSLCTWQMCNNWCSSMACRLSTFYSIDVCCHTHVHVLRSGHMNGFLKRKNTLILKQVFVLLRSPSITFLICSSGISQPSWIY